MIRWDRYAEITRNLNTSTSDGSTDNSGSDFSFDEGTGDSTTADPGAEIILSNYPCTINESVQYDTSMQGESYKGSARLKGMLTNKLKKGDLIDGEYKIITTPKPIHGRYIQCQLVKLG